MYGLGFRVYLSKESEARCMRRGQFHCCEWTYVLVTPDETKQSPLSLAFTNQYTCHVIILPSMVFFDLAMVEKGINILKIQL